MHAVLVPHDLAEPHLVGRHTERATQVSGPIADVSA